MPGICKGINHESYLRRRACGGCPSRKLSPIEDEFFYSVLNRSSLLVEYSLNTYQRFRRERFYVVLFTLWEWEHRQYADGLIEDDYLPVSDWSAIMETFPGMRDVWTVDRGRSQRFVEFMDANVVN